MSGGEGFEGWARAVTPRLLRLAALSGGGDPGAGADDVVQDVLVEVLGRWSRLSRLEHLDAYAARMVLNRGFTLARSRTRRERRHRLVAVPERSAPWTQRVEDADELARALAGLGERQRAVVLLRHVDGLTDDAVAAALGCTVSTVRSQSSRALAHLRAALSDDTNARRP